MGVVDQVDDFAEVSHQSQVALVVHDLQGCGIACQDFDRIVGFVRIRVAGDNAPIEDYFAIYANAHVGTLAGYHV